MRIRVIFIVMVLLLLSFSGCSKDANESSKSSKEINELTISTYVENQYLHEVANAYMQENSNIETKQKKS
ncbi:MAG: hypothetical protein ACK5LT_05645 [Lachnospirales bacterium]